MVSQTVCHLGQAAMRQVKVSVRSLDWAPGALSGGCVCQLGILLIKMYPSREGHCVKGRWGHSEQSGQSENWQLPWEGNNGDSQQGGNETVPCGPARTNCHWNWQFLLPIHEKGPLMRWSFSVKNRRIYRSDSMLVLIVITKCQLLPLHRRLIWPLKALNGVSTKHTTRHSHVV